MTNLKLVLVSQTKCGPCAVMKNQVLSRMDELTEIGAEFEYINLDGLEDKDTFIEKHKLSSTPTTWVQKDGQTVKEFTGYIDIDTLFAWVIDIKEDDLNV